MPAVAQRACGNMWVQFAVKKKHAPDAARAKAGKALVYFVERDVGTMLGSLDRVGMDGKWVGATHGISYFSFYTDPGVHHLCVAAKFGGLLAGEQTALFGFTAEAGKVYYIEARDVNWGSGARSDLTLAALNSDEGQLLVSTEEQSVFHRKK
jgi:hypothetical protein